MTEPSCWARDLSHVLDYAVRRGADRTALLGRAKVDPARLEDPDGRVALATYYAGVEAAAEALGDPHFGLHYGEAVEPFAMDAVGLLTTASRTVGEAVQRIVRFRRLMSDGEVFDLELMGGRAVFRFVPFGRFRLAHVHVTERYAAECLLLPRRDTGTTVDLQAFQLAHPARCDGKEFVRRFGRAPQFDAGHNVWSLAAEVLERPLPKADPGLVQLFERFPEEKARAPVVPGTLRERVHRLLCEGMPEGHVSVTAVAQALSMSERTVQRHLSSEGTSVDALLEEARRTRSTVLLGMGLPAAEVSLLLGYADPSAFQRAFKRWLGDTPRGWRAKQQRAAS
jgi:AraC-like DNA-binding protein